MPRVYAGTARDHPVWEIMRDRIAAEGITSSTVSFSASDQDPFVRGNIPISGLYTGALEPSPDGRPSDPCYHQACDDAENIDAPMLELMADTLAHGVLAAAG